MTYFPNCAVPLKPRQMCKSSTLRNFETQAKDLCTEYGFVFHICYKIQILSPLYIYICPFSRIYLLQSTAILYCVCNLCYTFPYHSTVPLTVNACPYYTVCLSIKQRRPPFCMLPLKHSINPQGVTFSNTVLPTHSTWKQIVHILCFRTNSTGRK